MKTTPENKETGQQKFSRRRFLTGIGAGAAAGAITLPEKAIGAVIDRSSGQQTNGAPDRFGRLFPNLSSFAPATPQVKTALMEIGRPGGILDAKDPLEVGPIRLITEPGLSPNNRDNPFQTAGTTFFGQFLDHDMTFDTSSSLGVPKRPEDAPNTRTPALDLDSVYGRGPVADRLLYDPADQDKLRVESGGLFEDLPRLASRQAIIADPRNDENIIIAGLHAAFLLFHNRVVDYVRSQGVPPSDVFAQARRLVTWHYQWIIVNEFLPQIIGRPLVDHILHFGRQFYRPAPGAQNIPVEFQGAVYRFGHSQVRPSYRANLAGDQGQPFFGFIFDPSGEGQADPVDLRGGARAQRRFIGWQTFFDFRDGQVKPNKRIDSKISTPLFQLPLNTIPGSELSVTSLSQRNLLRHLTWSLPSGQAIARAMGIPTLDPGQLSELASFRLGFERSTPLWYYILKEAELISDGIQLGPMGGRLVGEVFIGLLQLDPNSYLATNAAWQPTLPSRNRGDFKIADLLTFARVDPRSRGQ